MSIEDRMTKLEITIKEWRKHHDIMSEEIWDNIREKIDGIQSRMSCEVHDERMKSIFVRMNWLYVFVTVVLVGGVVLGLWIKNVG